MAYSKNRRLADLVATDGTMDAAKLKAGTVTSAHLHSSHGITTANIAEGSNKYYTDERVDDRSNSLLQDGSNISLTYDDSGGTLTIAATDTNTTYSAGTGLALSSTTFSLSHLGLQSLSDPNADRIAFWDDSAGAFAWLTIGSNLTVSGTTLSGVAAYGDSDVDSHLSGGTGVTYSSGAISIGQAVATSSNVTFADLAATGNVTVTGNLTVNGTQTTLSTATLDVEDKNITLNKGSGDTSASADGAGITIQDAVNSSTDATLLWDATNDRFDFSHPLEITNNGTTDTLLLTSTEASSTAAPVFTFKRNSGSPADADYLGQLKFKGENDADQEVVYAKITSKIQDASDGSEDGLLEFANVKAGSATITARLKSDKLQLLNSTGLEVAGLTYPTSDGSNGQFLKTDGSGALSFATPTDTNTTYSAGTGISLSGTTFSTSDGAIVHDNLSGFVANEHIDWTASGAGTIHSSNYTDTNTTYSVGDGGLTQNNFTNTLKSKLDGIEASATADQSAAEILTAIKTVDGASSGLDSDLLDGQEGSYYAASSGNATQSWVNSQGFVTSAVSLSANNTFTGANSFSNVYTEFGNGVASVSNSGSWHGRVNVSGTNHGRIDVNTNTDGITATMYAHDGHDGPRFGSTSNHPVDIMVNGSAKVKIDGNGKIFPGDASSARGYIGAVGTHDISLHSVRDITFDWDGNYDHIAYHGLFSQNSAGTYTDSMCLKSFDDITMMLDSNNNDSASYFRITNNTNDGSGVIGYIGFDGTQPIWSMPSSSTKLQFSGSSTTYGIGTGGNNYNTAYLDTCDSGTNSDVLELVYYSGAGVKIGASGGTKPIYASIYYDGNSTGYYGDFASTSNMYTIQNQNTLTYPTSNGASSSEGGVSYAIYQESGAWSSPYPELQIGFHTGINIGGHSSYNGTRIFTNSDMGTINHQFAGSSNYQYKHVWENTTTAGYYSSSGGGFHFQPSDTGSYGSADLIGSRGSYGGLLIEYGSVVIGMYDSGGNGGSYRQDNSKWHHYFHVGNACLGVNGSSTSSSYGLYVTGAIYATGDIVGSSDERLKKNINTIECGLDKVLRMRGVTYEWKDKEATGLDENKSKNTNTTPVRMGVIAQEILDIVPEAVVYDKENDRYGVEYGHLTGLLIEAIKDLNTKVEDLERKLEEK